MCLDACNNFSSLITFWQHADNSPQCCCSCLLSLYRFVLHSSLMHLRACLLFGCCSPWESGLYPFISSSSSVQHLLKSAPQLTKVWGRTWLFGDDRGELGALTWHSFSWDWHSEKSSAPKPWEFIAEREVITCFALKKKEKKRKGKLRE